MWYGKFSRLLITVTKLLSWKDYINSPSLKGYEVDPLIFSLVSSFIFLTIYTIFKCLCIAPFYWRVSVWQARVLYSSRIKAVSSRPIRKTELVPGSWIWGIWYREVIVKVWWVGRFERLNSMKQPKRLIILMDAATISRITRAEG